MCSRQLGMWTRTSTGKQKKTRITARHHMNTCWVTTTKKQRPRTAHAGPTPSENPPTKMGRWNELSTPKTGQKLDRTSPLGMFFSLKNVSTELIKTSSVPIKRAWWFCSIRVRSEEHVFVFDEHLHHLSLVPDVIEGCDGVHVWCPHQGGSKDDGEVLRVHQVEFFILRHPAVSRKRKVFKLTDGLMVQLVLTQQFKKVLFKWPSDDVAARWWQRSPL